MNRTGEHSIQTPITSKLTMMQPSSIYEAIKNDDYQGLISLYAMAVYDAVHSADFAASVCGDEMMRKDATSILMPTLQRDRSDSDESSRDVAIFFDGGYCNINSLFRSEFAVWCTIFRLLLQSDDVLFSAHM